MSALVNTTPPATEPFDVTEAKEHLRVTASTDDTLIGLLITAARTAAEEFLQRRLITQTWVYYLDDFCYDETEIELPYPPLQSVTQVEYKDPATGNYAVWNSSNYVVDAVSQPGRISWAPSTTQWPVVQDSSINAVKITYVCGYGAAAAVPEQINQAIKLMVGHLYENRETITLAAIPSELPKSFDYLLMPFKIFKF